METEKKGITQIKPIKLRTKSAGKFHKQLRCLFIIFFVFSGSLTYSQQENAFSIFLTGNTEGEISDTLLLNRLKRQAAERENFAFLFAGNVISNQTEQFSEEFIINKNHPLLIAPGKAEWKGGSRKGKDFIKQLFDDLSEKYSNPIFFPKEACPGPAEIVLNDHLVVILLDTWWWVHKYDRRFNKCGIEDPGDVLIQTEDAVRRHYADKHVIIAGHHNLKSFGNTSGYFSFRQWLFELPYTFFRKLPGSKQDSRHPDFKNFRNGMLSVLKKYPDVLYVSAGEANMQYFQHQNTHFVISGSWKNQEYLKESLPEFGSDDNGFARLDFSSNGDCFVNFFNTNDSLFQKKIYHRNFISSDVKTLYTKKLPDSLAAVASTKYDVSGPAHIWMGKNYRDEWKTPVTVPVFDIGSKKGGLKVVKRGGGQQTMSLRLEDKNGKQYVLRSLNKYAEGFMPEGLHKTFAVDLVQDQISASNPFAAPVVAELAEYAGVFHTNPEVVYVPDDPRFGIYRQDVADNLFLFEERPDDDRSDVASFGRSRNIISTEKVLREIHKSPKHSVDENSLLRARLFDIIINDWDRHEDQWRWAGFGQNGLTIYKPIPRDRDQAFFVNEGVVPWLASRNWLLSKIQGFTECTKNMEGHAYNARYFDRSFLTESSLEDWLLQADTLRHLLSPEKIDSAMYAFPKEIYPLSSPQTARILKARVENIHIMAGKLYLLLAKEVSIIGSKESDLFEIVTRSDTLMQISVYELKKDGQKGRRFYYREFYASETKKIQIYGLEGKDRFELIGKSSRKIKLKIIGGKDKDEVLNKSQFSQKSIAVYDKENTIILSESTAILKSRYDPDALEYDRKHFEYNVVYPGVFSGYNPDDGIFIGGGPIFNKYSRYHQQRYKVLGNYAFATNAFNLHFDARQIFPLQRLEINFKTQYNSPEYAGNFLGMGNETEWEAEHSEKEYYRLRMRRLYTELDFIKAIDDDKTHKAGPGLFYSFADAQQTAERFISLPESGLTEDDLAAHTYVGAYLKYELNTLAGKEQKTEEKFIGSNTFPTRGMQLNTRIGYFAGLNEQTNSFLKFSGDWIAYLSFSQRPRVVYALRVGGEKLFGDYAFHEAATLGQSENLRAYRETRFYGDASLFFNAEIRIRMKHFQTYLLNGTAGVLLFNDIGRVWLKGEYSKKWHNGIGVGLWFSPFDMAAVSVSYAVGSEDGLFNLSINYQF